MYVRNAAMKASSGTESVPAVAHGTAWRNRLRHRLSNPLPAHGLQWIFLTGSWSFPRWIWNQRCGIEPVWENWIVCWGAVL